MSYFDWLYSKDQRFAKVMSEPIPDRSLIEALDDIIQGSVVNRTRHNLIHDGADLTGIFIQRLFMHGYKPRTVGNIPCEPGERVPAFYLDGFTAYFGWVFWEKFSARKIRKLWGSVVKNSKGDWRIQIPVVAQTVIYANELMKIEMDIDHPSDV